MGQFIARLGRGVGIVCAIGAAATGVAWATGAVGGATGGVVQACVNRVNGDVRIVGDNTTDCRRGEKSVSWAAAGTPGPAGAPGKDGTSVTSASATTLAPGADATATFDTATGALALGIPQGAKGDPGLDGKNGTSVTSVDATTLAPGSDATAAFDSATGALMLGIPQGEPGKDGAASSGGSQVVTRVRLGQPLTFLDATATTSKITFPSLPLTGATWTQSPGEVDLIVGGTVSYNVPAGSACNLDFSATAAGLSYTQKNVTAGSYTARLGSDTGADIQTYFEPDTAATHTITGSASETSDGGPIGCDVTVTGISLDVIGLS